MSALTVVILLGCFFVAMALGTQNQQVINFDFLIAQGDFQLSTLLGIAFGSGFGLGWLICGLLYLKARFARNRLRKKVQKQQTELNQLRAEPVKE
ncbi:lipopolysaccharide assembly protein LapA domain-containing protein [Photobacterium japonica]